MFELAGLDAELADALYRLDAEPACNPLFPDVPGVLAAIQGFGVRIGLVSDIHFELRPTLAEQGIGHLFDESALSSRRIEASSGASDAAAGLLVPAACRPVGRMIHQPTPTAGSNGREHQQHRPDPDEHHREATRAVLVGRPAGASIAASHRVVKEEPGCHQGNAENLYDATHLSSLQLRVAHDPHLRTVVGRPRQPAGLAGRRRVTTSPMVAEPDRYRPSHRQHLPQGTINPTPRTR